MAPTTATDNLAAYCQALNYWRSLTTENSTYRGRMAAYSRMVEAHKVLTVDQQVSLAY